VLQKAGDISETHKQLIYVLRTRQYNSSNASAKSNVLWKINQSTSVQGTFTHSHSMDQ